MTSFQPCIEILEPRNGTTVVLLETSSIPMIAPGQASKNTLPCCAFSCLAMISKRRAIRLTAEVRARLSEIPLEVAGNRPQGDNQPRWNDDGPCLLTAAEGLLALLYEERVLIVISDGLQEGSHSNATDLAKPSLS
jgi:hypothetical protein